MATITELYTIDAMRMDDSARHLARTGVSLSHRDYRAIGGDRIAWLRDRLELIMTTDDRGVHFQPATATSACFVADAPGTYGSSDGRVWSAHATVEEGRAAIRSSAGAGVILHHGSLEPGTVWTSSMERAYPEVK